VNQGVGSLDWRGRAASSGGEVWVAEFLPFLHNCGRAMMISYQDALATVLSHALPLETMRVELGQLLGYFLAEPVVAGADSPLFDNSAVDGFGVHAADVTEASPTSPVRLRLRTTIRAGDAAEGKLSPGSAVKVLTGAPMPCGVEAVVMREFCTESAGEVIVKQAVGTGEDIRGRGKEFRRGDEALPIGMRVTPPVVGLLATFGYTEFSVHRKPRVALIVTGNELVQPGRPLRPGQIYDSNSAMLVAALRGMGIEDCAVTQTRDEPASIKGQLTHDLESADAVVTVGGVSVGDYDFVKEVCDEIGVKTHLWQVAIKPGKPFYFGTIARGEGNREKLIFGLPGNPVSAALTFHEMVKPVLLKMMGAKDVSPVLLSATLATNLRKEAGRMEFVRGVVTREDGRLVVRPTPGQDSHMVSGLARANCLIHFPRAGELLAEGEEVTVELIDWD